MRRRDDSSDLESGPSRHPAQKQGMFPVQIIQIGHAVKSFFLEDTDCGRKTTGNGKGCDFGYALAISSCERAHSVEACTVTALDAITAFAVPNPNYPSQGRRFFQVWLLIGSPRRADHSAYFGLAKFYLSQPFQPSTRATLEIYSTIVNAPFRCNRPLALEQKAETQTIESLLLNELHFKFLSTYAQIVHRDSKHGPGA
jgi:hypothetical protein